MNGFFDPVNIWARLPLLLVLIPVVMLHELGHAITALKLGDTTARDMGRITLNPLKHMDLIGTLLILTIGFGWAKPVMVNPHNLRIGHKLGFAIVALAGPAVNFVLALIMAVIMAVFAHSLGILSFGMTGGFLHYYAPHHLHISDTQFSILTYIYQVLTTTVLLGVFNLIPVPPLDGSKILGLLLPDGLYARFVYNNVIGLVFVAVLALTGMFERIIFPALNWVMAVLLLPLMNVIMAFLYN